jgi:predicted AlkP superfamily phosphohydrolase/phosphomutase
MSRILIIGLDGATPRLFDDLARRSVLPSAQGLRANGCYGVLRSTVPELSPVAWSSFVTSKNPGKHGIYGFTVTKPDSYDVQLVSARCRRAKPFWSLLSDQGMKVGVVNVPISYPPDPVNGYFVSGMDAPDTSVEYTYPPELKGEIENIVKDYVIDLSLLGQQMKRRPSKIASDLVNAERKRVEVCKELMDRFDWDVFFVVLMAIDRTQHWFWHCQEPNHLRYEPHAPEEDRDVVANTYRAMDGLVGELVAHAGDETTVFVVSDHGFGPFDDTVPYLNLNDWLINQGLMYLSGGGRGSALSSALRAGVKALRAMLPFFLRRRLKALLPSVREWTLSRQYFANIDWSRTRVYCPYDECLTRTLRVNLRGREPQGIVESGEDYDQLVHELIEGINALRHPLTGKKLAERVFRREEIYSGPYVPEAPDVLVLWGEDAFFAGNDVSDRRRYEQATRYEQVFRMVGHERTGEHRRDGILVALGPKIRKAGRIEPCEIVDVVPTMLYLLGQAVPEDMDGRVLTEIIEPDVLGAQPIRKGKPTDDAGQPPDSVYSKEEERKIAERLKQLGYM